MGRIYVSGCRLSNQESPVKTFPWPAPATSRPYRASDWSRLLAGHNVGPERIDFVGAEQPAQGRHGVLAPRQHVHEAGLLVLRKLPQVEGALRIGHRSEEHTSELQSPYDLV